jgi:hypothetical protein
MAVTYEQARELVRAKFEPNWTHGTFCLDDRQIVESDEMYVFTVGAREFLVDGDQGYAVLGGLPVVIKETGEISQRPSVLIATDDRFEERPNPEPTLQV